MKNRIRLLLILAGLIAGRPLIAAAASALDWSKLPDLPDRAGMAGAFAGVSDNALIVGGGANFPDAPPWEGGRKVWHDAVYVLTAPNAQWQTGFKLPRPLAYGVSVNAKAGVVCAGGSDADRHHADVFLLRWTGSALESQPLPALPQACANLCGAVLGDTLYVAGGTAAPDSTATLKTFWALDLAKPDTGWKQLEPWPGPGRMLAMAGVQGGYFYLVGGVDLTADAAGKPQRQYLADAYRFDPKSGWKQIADLPRPLAAAPSPAPATGQAHLLVLGGDDGSKMHLPAAERPGFFSEVLAYHTITDTWAAQGEVPAARVTVPTTTWQGRLVIPSGEMQPGVRSPEIWAFAASPGKAGFGWLNYTTLAVYLLAMVAFGLSFTRKNKTTDDFFRASQRIPWWAAGLSIFATMLSSITFMAIPAQAYLVGWNFFVANAYLIMTPLVIAVYLPFYRRLNVTSAYEYLERRFNVATRLVASGLFILFQCGRIAIVLYLPALAMATVSKLDVSTSIILMGVLCVVYTMMGGIEAVIWVDAAQTVVLLGGALLALVMVVFKLNGGPGDMISIAAEHGKFFQTLPWSWDYTIATGWIIMLGSIFTNLFPYTASQDVVQRYVTTSDDRGARRAIWTNALMCIPAQALFFAIGTALFVFYREHPQRLDPAMSNDAIFPLFIVREMPAGVAGIIVAALFAAAQSTLSSSLNSVATAYVTDFHLRFRPHSPDKFRLRLAQALTGAVGLAGTGAALILARSDIRSLWETFLSVIGLFGGTISGLFVLGIFSRRAHGNGALFGALVSAALVYYVSSHKLTTFWCYAIIGVTACVVIGWLASFILPGPKSAPDGLTVYTLKRENS